MEYSNADIKNRFVQISNVQIFIIHATQNETNYAFNLVKERQLNSSDSHYYLNLIRKKCYNTNVLN